MSKQYEKLARDIVDKVGGPGNISAARHCQTRLRFNLADNSKADKTAIQAMDGVAQVVESGGMFQVVIGLHVKEVYEEVEKLLPSQEETSALTGEKRKFSVNTIIDFISGVFQPIIPALSGAGMVKALLAILVTFHLIDNQSQTYAILNLFADATFAFLPMLLAYTTARKMKCNVILAMGVAGIMLHSSWAAMAAAGDPVHFFGVIPFRLVSYTSSVVPIILVILVQSFVEKWLDRVIPKAVNLIFVPMLTFLIMGTLSLSILGPIGSYVGEGLAVVFDWLSTNASWAPSVLIGGLLPVMVMLGLHHGVAPLGSMQMSSLGHDSIFGPGCVCSNIAQGVAALVVSVRTKDAKTRQVSASSGVTALMGITEPVLYGVNLPKKYPLAGAMIGGACGGLFAGLTHTHRFATGSSGIPAVFLYIGDNTMQYFINIIIALIITAVVTAIVTFVLSLKFEGKEEKKPEPVQTLDIPANTVSAPAEGSLIPMEQIPDKTFSTGVLGIGVGIQPVKGEITAPFNGTVTQVADTGHALGLLSTDGLELLIHVGVDTVEMNGKGFTPKVQEGGAIRAGQILMHFDKAAIAAAGHPDVVVVMLTNADEYKNVTCAPAGDVKPGTDIIHAEK